MRRWPEILLTLVLFAVVMAVVSWVVNATVPRWVPVTESASKATVWLVSADRGSFTVGHDLNPATDRTFRFEMRRS
jgi:peptidoglycan biosynthesis protein MviN/MurJ (putative lipid II flippase)